ncbi:YccT family protein [Photobacterium nomapromontoriensis]|uniref:YccT family protein n=1 Tax=Photobacterium nomapromontoriensis TaxID=2910237 RepID=UPI003D1512BD
MKKWLVGVGLLMLPLGLQAATLSMGDNIKLLVVDGKKVASSFWTETESVPLAAGKHQVVVQFDGEVKSGSKTTIYTTQPYLFELDVPNEDATIVLPRLTSLSQAKAHFQRGPQWQLELANGAKTKLDYVVLEGNGFAAYRDMEALVAEYNRKQGITFEQGYAVDLEKTVVDVSDKGEVSITGDALAQLKLWYSKANVKEKVAFEQWMATQSAQ